MAQRKRRKKGRERIYGFSWQTPSGFKQAIYENDLDSREQFLKERRYFLRHNIKIEDYKTRKPYRRD